MHLFLVGAGPVGLVTAAGLARRGHHVTVTDIDGERIDGLRAGRSPIFEPGLEAAIRARAAEGSLDFTTDGAPPAGANVSLVCVGTPAGPDGLLSMVHVEAAVAALLAAVPPAHVIVVRSTLPLDGPDRLAELVERRSEAAGSSATVVTNPEFMREGQGLEDFDRPARVVTGWLRPADEPAARQAADLYAPLGAPTLVADARSVALIKLASNVFLATKIAFANELSRLCDAVGADVDLVTAGIGMDDRIGRAFLRAGPGYGGSCLPGQAIALARTMANAGIDSPLIGSVARSNEAHQRGVVARIGALLAEAKAPVPAAGRSDGLDGARIAVLGLAFKAGTDDVRDSPALNLARWLGDGGASVVGYDPRAGAAARAAHPELEIAGSTADAVAGADAVVVATEWPEFGGLDWTTLAATMRGRLVYDTRAIVDREGALAAGLRVEVLGRR